MAQPPSLTSQYQQQTSGVIGIAAGQTARLNVLYPRVPAPIFQVSCSATLAIADDQDSLLKTGNVSQLSGGKSFSVELNADTDLAHAVRTEIHGISVAPTGCTFVMTLELIDNATQKTLVVVNGETTYPRLSPVSSRVAAEPAHNP